MGEELMGQIVAVVLIVVVIGGFVVGRSRTRRWKEKLQETAAELGMTHHERGDRLGELPIKEIPYLRDVHQNRRFCYLIFGSRENLDCYYFSSFAAGKASNNSTTERIGLIKLNGSQLPAFELTGNLPLDGLMAKALMKTSPGKRFFNIDNRFTCSIEGGADTESSLRRILSFELHQLSEAKGWRLNAEGSWLVFRRSPNRFPIQEREWIQLTTVFAREISAKAGREHV